jgi:hypothetical protein
MKVKAIFSITMISIKIEINSKLKLSVQEMAILKMRMAECLWPDINPGATGAPLLPKAENPLRRTNRRWW